MKRAFSLCAAALMLTLALPVSALAAETAAVCYPTSVTRSEDGTELKKIYDLAPEEDPAGIPRSDFCLLYTSPSPRDRSVSRMPSSA